MKYISIFFIVIAALFFLPVFTKTQVPLPLNLLVSYYSPWRVEGYNAANKPIGFDVVRQMIPYQKFTKDALNNGNIPLWNPYVFAGNPHIASFQPAFFYPGTLLFSLFSLENAWTILVIIQPILTGLFMFLFLTRQKLSRKASLFGALAWAFSGWMICWWEESLVIVHSIIWLPLALIGNPFLLTLSLVLSVFAGFTQSTIYLFLTVLAWYLYQKKFKLLFVSSISALCITAIQWIPTLEAFLRSPRSTTDAAYIFSTHLLPLQSFVTLFAPDFWGNTGTYNMFGHDGFYHERVIYLGLVPLLFSLVAIFHKKNKFWTWFTLITFSMVFALPTSWIPHYIPLLSSMQPTRIMMIATFGFSVLAAYGLEYFFQKNNRKIFAYPLLFIAVLATATWSWVFYAKSIANPQIHTETMNLIVQYATISFRNLILPSATLISLTCIIGLFYKNQKLFYCSLLTVHLLTMWYFAKKYLYFSDRKNMYPEISVLTKIKELSGVNRVWGYGNATVENNILSYYGLYTAEGYDAFFDANYANFLGTTARSDATLKHADEVEKMTDNPERLQRMSILGVKYIFESKTGDGKDRQKTQDRFPPHVFSLAWENEIWRIWEYKDALPRAQLSTGIATITDYQSNTVTITTESSQSGTLILSDSYYPGWQATIDGNPTLITKAHNAFREVSVPSGNHEIIFTYKPKSFVWGAILSGIGLIIFLVSFKYFKIH